MSKASRCQPTVVRRADGSVYSQHRITATVEALPDDHRRRGRRPVPVSLPTPGALALLAKQENREKRRQKRLAETPR